MSRFKIEHLPLEGLQVVERVEIGDARGFLSRIFCADQLSTAGWTRPIAQINQTLTATLGTVRGLHFQLPPHAEMKLVSCLAGTVWDVAVDLRRGSPTFLHWHAEILSAENRRAMLIPEGFAHGFQSLADGVVMLYCHSAAYHAGAEAGLHPKDPALAVRWPLEISDLSTRDAKHAMITPQFAGVDL